MTVREIIISTYGNGSMPHALADYIEEELQNLPASVDRETWLRNVCWNWFSGGTTAEGVAARIEAALNGAE